MKQLLTIGILFAIVNTTFSQTNAFENKKFIEKLYQDQNYLALKQKVSQEFAHSKPGNWGEFVKGVDEDLVTNKKIIAFTFDACGGKNSDGYYVELIDFLRKEKIQATLFVTGKWIDANYLTFLELSKDPLFEIENHGFNHQPCSVDGESEYVNHPQCINEDKLLPILTNQKMNSYLKEIADLCGIKKDLTFHSPPYFCDNSNAYKWCSHRKC